MKRYLLALALLATAPAFAQRATPCSPTTPNNAVCIGWGQVVERTDGLPVLLPVTYRVERQFGTGTFTQIGTPSAALQYYDQGLAPGTYTYRVYAIEGTTVSAPSNSAGRAVTQAPPNAPVITIAVLIRLNAAPVYSVVGSTAPYRQGEFYCVVPAGRSCGDFMYTARGLRWHRVIPEAGECWYYDGSRPLAAPCGAAT
jgi:hypothetical protein